MDRCSWDACDFSESAPAPDDVVDTSDSWTDTPGANSDLLIPSFRVLTVLRGLVVDGEGHPQRNLIF